MAEVVKDDGRRWTAFGEFMGGSVTQAERVVTVKRVPKFLFDAYGQVRFGWMLAGYSAQRTGGKWEIVLRLKRHDGCVRVMEPTPAGWMEPVKFHVYQRASVLTSIRMLWLLLWSKPYTQTKE